MSEEKEKKQNKKKVNWKFVLPFVIIVVIGVVIFFWRYNKNSTHMDITMVCENIQKKADLHVMKCLDVCVQTADKKGKEVVKNPEYVVKFFGSADYVVDLKEATCLVNKAKNEMTIFLEEPTLTAINIDEGKTELIYAKDRSFRNGSELKGLEIFQGMKEKAQKEMNDDIEKIKDDQVKTARENAEKIIENFVSEVSEVYKWDISIEWH